MKTSTVSSLAVVDAHHHLWDLETLHYPWLATGGGEAMFGDYTPLCVSYRLRDYLQDAKAVDLKKSVHLQAEHDAGDPVKETQWLQSLADEPANMGFPHAIVGFADFSRSDVASLLDRHLEFANIRGVRQILSHHPDPKLSHAPVDYLLDEDWRRRFSLLGRRGLSFDLQLYAHQTAEAARLARNNKDILLILNHAGTPEGRTASNFNCWREGMLTLAACENIVAKISGLGMSEPSWTVDSIRPYVLETIEIFGVERCMFASNFPVDKLFSDYATLFGAFDEITERFSAGERARLFRLNAEKYYRI